MEATIAKILVKGEKIVICHDKGDETATLLGWTNFGGFIAENHPAIRVDVQFADGTISSWGWLEIDTIATLNARNNNN